MHCKHLAWSLATPRILRGGTINCNEESMKCITAAKPRLEKILDKIRSNRNFTKWTVQFKYINFNKITIRKMLFQEYAEPPAEKCWKDIDQDRHQVTFIQFHLRFFPKNYFRIKSYCSSLAIPSRGVVQLFNAVREQQKDMKSQLKQAGGSFRKQEKVKIVSGNNMRRQRFCLLKSDLVTDGTKHQNFNYWFPGVEDY